MTKILIHWKRVGEWFTPRMINRYGELSGFNLTPYRVITHKHLQLLDYQQLESISGVPVKRDYSIKWRKDDLTFLDITAIERDDPNLIQAVEEVINEKYNGKYDQFVFKVVEIPDDVKWYIELTDTDYNCYEEIIEEHRIWG